MATAMEITEAPDQLSAEEIGTNGTTNNGNKTRIKKRQRNSLKEIVFDNAKEVEVAVIKENH